MPPDSQLKIAFVGNPNSGKTSLFNKLTGLNQKVGNFPGVTVDVKEGSFQLDASHKAKVIDLPGIYSIYPKSVDEQIVSEVLLDPSNSNYPDVVVVTVDATNLRRNLLLFTQIRDLGFSTVLALNMIDLAESNKIEINTQQLSEHLGIPVVGVNGRTGKGTDELKKAILTAQKPAIRDGEYPKVEKVLLDKVKDRFGIKSDYHTIQLLHQFQNLQFLGQDDKNFFRQTVDEHGFSSIDLQQEETLKRYTFLNDIIASNVVESIPGERERVSNKIDTVLTHKVWGFVIFLALLFFIFQAVFAWASYPMDFIDGAIADFASWVKVKLPEGAISDLLTDGVIAGLGGIFIFIPQIAILFAFISVLEETGYMSRVVFIMDKIMRRFGLNGKSVVPLISGVACAVPAIMSARLIDNWKERTITIFVTPLMSCSARLPVFTVLVGLMVPEETVWGIFNLQGLILMAAYAVGFLAAVGSALLLKFFLKASRKSYFIMELPTYKIPRWKNVGRVIVEKVGIFVFDAGKVIMAISIVLWVLASYGPGDKMEQAEDMVKQEWKETDYDSHEFALKVQSKKLEMSYAGHFGKWMEPAIEPLGYDWKIGIALITSFAAREVFVGTMSTIYSVGAEDEDRKIISRIKKVKGSDGEIFFNLPRSLSLFVFYLFAMQCMSTLAIVYSETKSIKWPILQFVYMTALAYLSSFLVYQSLS